MVEGDDNEQSKTGDVKPEKKRTRKRSQDDDVRRNRRVHQNALTRIASIYTVEGKLELYLTGSRLYESGSKTYPTRAKNEDANSSDTGLPMWRTSDWITALTKALKHAQRDTLRSKDSENQPQKAYRQPRRHELLQLLRLLIEPTADERKILGLPTLEHLPLLERALLNVLSEPDNNRAQVMAESIYRSSVDLNINYNRIFTSQLDEDEQPDKITQQEPLDKATSIIRKGVKQLVKNLHGKLEEDESWKAVYKNWQKFSNDLANKAVQELNRILIESGVNTIGCESAYIDQYLPPDILQRLPLIIDSNEHITNYFPIHLDSYDIECCGPLPLGISDIPNGDRMLLSRDLLSVDVNDKELQELINAGLHFQHVIEMRLDFRLRFTSLEEGISEETEIFSIRGRGVGGHLSLAHRLINLALLSDIVCLQSYFPVAKDRFVQHEVIGRRTSSIVHSHFVVQLCQDKALGKALHSTGNYDDFSEFDPIGQADYVGFGLPLTTMRAKTLATLDAIRAALVTPKEYIDDLREKIKYSRQIENATSLIKNYPFSLMVAEGYLKETGNLLDKYGPRFEEKREELKVIQNALEESSDPKTKTKLEEKLQTLISKILQEIPNAYFDSVLSLIHEFLGQGFYRQAFCELNKLEPFLGVLTREMIEQGNSRQPKSFHLFSGSILARYELAFARYYFTTDCQAEQEKYSPQQRRIQSGVNHPNQGDFVRRAWEILDKASKHLNLRQTKYQAISEPSQSAFFPYYDLKGQICLTRAMICLLSPEYIDTEKLNKCVPSRLKDFIINEEKHQRAVAIQFSLLHWLEKARLFAAMNASQDLYIRCTAFQCIAFIMAGNTLEKSIESEESSKSPINKNWAWNWAYNLRKEAILRYEQIGKDCYYQMKEKSGVDQSIEYKKGNVKVLYLNNIYEYRSQLPNTPEEQQDQKKLLDTLRARKTLCIDLSYILVLRSELGFPNSSSETIHDSGIYLFGPSACYLFLVRGIYHLCSQEHEEFKQNEVNSIADWKHKLERAYQLLNYAWCMADDLCILDEETDCKIISRNVPSYEGYTFSDVASSVGCLIPLRVTEVATLGKVFAATCLLLKKILPEEDQILEQLEKDRRFLLREDQLYSSLHSSNLQEFDSQVRYNGFLEPCLDRVRSILYADKSPDLVEITNSFKITNSKLVEWKKIAKVRDELIRKLFEAFQGF